MTGSLIVGVDPGRYGHGVVVLGPDGAEVMRARIANEANAIDAFVDQVLELVGGPGRALWVIEADGGDGVVLIGELLRREELVTTLTPAEVAVRRKGRRQIASPLAMASLANSTAWMYSSRPRLVSMGPPRPAVTVPPARAADSAPGPASSAALGRDDRSSAPKIASSAIRKRPSSRPWSACASAGGRRRPGAGRRWPVGRRRG